MSSLTIMDIAREAGVSKATVSRVMNHTGSVSEKTRERVLSVIRDRQFTPSPTARNLSTGVSSAIGFVVPEIDNPFFGEILRGVMEITDENGLMLIFYSTDDDAEKDRKALTLLEDNQVCGILYTPAVDYGSPEEKKELRDILKGINVLVVMLDRNIGLEELDGVYFDDYHGMFDATVSLIRDGHRRIGIINATLDRVLARQRQQGYLDALRENGIDPDESLMYFGDFSATRAYALGKELLDRKDRPTAVLTCNNRTTVGFLRALYERGETASDDITVFGLDRIEVLDTIGFPLSFIERDARQMGRKAAKLLINRMKYPERPRIEAVLDTRLVINR